MSTGFEDLDWEVRIIRAAANDLHDLDTRLRSELGALSEQDDDLRDLVIFRLANFGGTMLLRLARELGIPPDELIDDYVQRHTDAADERRAEEP
jgi:hypothetical protein